MDKVLTTRQKPSANVVEASVFNFFAGYGKISPYKLMAFHRMKKSLNSKTQNALAKNPQSTFQETPNSSETQDTTLTPLALRAIQAFKDTENEWAEVYANLANS